MQEAADGYYGRSIADNVDQVNDHQKREQASLNRTKRGSNTVEDQYNKK